MEHILAVLNTYKPAAIRDIWCGSWRCFGACHEHLKHAFKYTGVDFSPSFVEIAREEYPQTTYPNAVFHCEDMLKYLKQQPAHSTDTIVGIASVQHLFTHQERALFFLEAYRTLSYWGVLILVNWSFSDRFLKSYTLACLGAAFRRCLSLGEKGRNDVSIPRKDQNYQNNKQRFSRFYHIFTHLELVRLAQQAGFHIEELCYIEKSWEKTQNRHTARNTFLIAKKMPVIG